MIYENWTDDPAFDYWRFIENNISRNAEMIHLCTGATYYTCVESAIHIMGHEKVQEFALLSARVITGEGLFTQTVVNIVLERENRLKLRDGKPIVKGSRGEIKVLNILSKMKIKFIREHSFKEMGRLRLDFYLPTHKAAIEYDGAQHSKPVAIWGGESALAKSIERDNKKNSVCADLGIRLLRIPHNTVDIETMIKDFIYG